MSDKTDEILVELLQLKSWLYGADGFEGDIPKIKKLLDNHNQRIRRIELILAGLIGSGAITGGVIGLIKLI